MAMIATGMIINLDPECIQQTIDTAKAPAHRLEQIGKFNDVLYVNDSKSTTIASTLEAIHAFNSPVILILGGRNKGGDFSTLAEAIRKSRVEDVIAYGEAGPVIRDALVQDGRPRITVQTRFDGALKLASSLAKPGTTVLLSPAAASQDQFIDFEERGDRFKQFVKELMA